VRCWGTPAVVGAAARLLCRGCLLACLVTRGKICKSRHSEGATTFLLRLHRGMLSSDTAGAEPGVVGSTGATHIEEVPDEVAHSTREQVTPTDLSQAPWVLNRTSTVQSTGRANDATTCEKESMSGRTSSSDDGAHWAPLARTPRGATGSGAASSATSSDSKSSSWSHHSLGCRASTN